MRLKHLFFNWIFVVLLSVLATWIILYWQFGYYFLLCLIPVFGYIAYKLLRHFQLLSNVDRKSMIRTGIKSFIYAIIGWVIFYSIDEYLFYWSHNINFLEEKYFFLDWFFVIALGIVLIAIPSFVGGMFLEYVLIKSMEKGYLSRITSIITGAMIGSYGTILLCLVVFFLSGGRMAYYLLLRRLAITTGMGLLTGALIGGSSNQLLVA